MGEPLRVGIVGLGNILGQYLDTFAALPDVTVAAVADLDAERAADVAADLSRTQGEAARAVTLEDLLSADDVDVVLNLTTPAAHARVALAAIAAGKPVYGEKPLAATMAEAAEVMRAAEARGVDVLCAPDTVLGVGIQTARRAVDDGLIGEPVAATATMVTPGHEAWHPNPDFYYLPGGGPLMDMGPYYVTALVHLLGPVVSVVGVGSRSRAARTVASGPRAGESFPVEVDTHVTGVLSHASGAVATLVMSFDAVATASSHLEVHGTAGSLAVPDPNQFDGEVRLAPLGGDGFAAIPPSAGYVEAGRGIGLFDWAENRPSAPRVSGEVGLHVLEIMESLLKSDGRTIALGSTAARPDPVPLTMCR
ncbi:oxidoreductase [Tessaracoccus aquimaris]|uniref:Oxidoreductase n=1 Tax=Tessaracoccus aquimaris TaxID=1332264 RepID=A0A1Q2CJL6_9ACTN|nr:Gfo/Idh/MocA family oxidoreductase [Tessaracoccus aquimaris]AQP46294.1 oxidoreductase [Tessaracoccus aquimaris]